MKTIHLKPRKRRGLRSKPAGGRCDGHQRTIKEPHGAAEYLAGRTEPRVGSASGTPGGTMARGFEAKMREPAIVDAAHESTPALDYSGTEDQALVRAAQQGDMAAFEELVARHSDKIYGRAFSMLRGHEAALDLSQDAWVKGWQRLGQFHGDSSFSTWLTRIVINLCLDQLRRQKRKPTDSIDEMNEQFGGVERRMPVVTVNPSARLERIDLRDRIDAALAKLSDEHRTVLVLREFEQMEYKEIAKAMSCSLGTIMSRLFYARRKMATLLAGMKRELLRN